MNKNASIHQVMTELLAEADWHDAAGDPGIDAPPESVVSYFTVPSGVGEAGIVVVTLSGTPWSGREVHEIHSEITHEDGSTTVLPTTHYVQPASMSVEAAREAARFMGITQLALAISGDTRGVQTREARR